MCTKVFPCFNNRHLDILSIDSQTVQCVCETEQGHVFAKPFVTLQVHGHWAAYRVNMQTLASRALGLGLGLQSPQSTAKWYVTWDKFVLNEP